MLKSRSRHLLLLMTLVIVTAVKGQVTPSSTLQPGTSIEKTLGSGQAHSYTINLEEAQFLQLIVDQHGIDVVVRVYAPNGRRLGEFDSPNGNEGPESVAVVAVAAGVYRIEVAPLSPINDPPAGRYEIKVTEVRKATEQELQSGRNQEQTKAKGLELLIQAAQSFPELHRPETRATFQMSAAQLLWETDERRAAKLIDQAMDGIKDFIATLDDVDRDYYESLQTMMQLRRQVVEVLTPHDPEKALSFLRSTRTLVNSQGPADDDAKQEAQLELSLVAKIAVADPKRALQMAEESLKSGYSSGLIQVLYQLRAKDPDLAARLAHEIAVRLIDENLIRTTEAGYLASSLIHAAKPQGTGGANLLSEDEYRDLFQKVLSELLAYSPPNTNVYSPERDGAQNLAQNLLNLTPELQKYAPDKRAALEEKMTSIRSSGDPQTELWTKYQSAVNENSTDSAMETINQAPAQLKESLYQQLAGRLMESGEGQRARQTIAEHIRNPQQRQQMLRNLDQRAIQIAIDKGRVDEAIRLLNGFRPLSERAMLISEIVTRIGPGLKRGATLNYLEQVRGTLDPSPKASDQSQMYALLQLARAFARYDLTRALEIVEPLVDQFNELSASAQVMNGFGQKYFRDGEAIPNNGNAISETANRLATALAAFAMSNFDRAKSTADRIHPLDIRLLVYLAIAQRTVQDTRGGVVDF